MKGTDTTQAIIYCRTGSALQGDHGLKEQEKRCRDFASARGYNVAAVYSDSGMSGTTRDRPSLEAMMSALRDHGASSPPIVIVEDIAHLARDMRLFVELRDEIKAAGSRVESPSYDAVDSAEGQLIENMMAARAELEDCEAAE